MHSLFYKDAPDSLTNVRITNAEENHNLNLCNTLDFTLPYPRIELIKRLLFTTLFATF
jgi:hypothetical protein